MYGAISMQTIDQSEHSKQRSLSSVGTVVGCLFALNYLIGNGFLAIPYALYHSGLFYGILTLLVVSFMSCVTAFWTLEVMSRAQALEYHRPSSNSKTFFNSIDDLNHTDRRPMHSRGGSDISGDSYFQQSYKRPLAYYEVLPDRKFEFAELCGIFLGRKMKYFYVMTLFLYLLFICWAYATVAGTTWASIIPWAPSKDWAQCTAKDFNYVYMPNDIKCRETYRFYIAVFGIIVLPLCCLEFKDQQFVQVLAAVFRFISIIVMTGQSIYYISSYDYIAANDCNSKNISHNATTNHSISILNVFSFDPFTFKTIGWLWSIPVFLQAQILQQSIPTMSYQISKPAKLGKIFLIAFVSSCFINVIYGSSLSMRFKGLTMENAALNWVDQRLSSNFVHSSCAYIILFLPSLEGISLFPMVSVTVANNIFVVLYGRDTSISMDIVPHSTLKKIIIRLLVGLLPILCSLTVANLFYVTKYAGIIGVLLAFVLPTLLQYRSQLKCRKTFADPDRDRRVEDADQQQGNTTPLRGTGIRRASSEVSFSPSITAIKERLLVKQVRDTPYSSVCSGNICIFLEIMFAVLVIFGSLMFYFWFPVYEEHKLKH